MSNDLVVQLGAKLDQFQSDLNAAGDMADSAVSKIEESFSKLNPGLGGFANLGLSIAGVTGSVGALLTALSSVNAELADIQKNAAFSNISTDRYQQIQYAAGQGGVSNSQSATDLANVSKLLADAKYNENSLTKILGENNIKYKDRNGEVINLNQLLTIAGGLLGRFDSIPDKTKAAQMLGLSEGWVEALRNGSKSFEDIASSANDVGVIIDAQTIAKAAAFDRAWKASSAQLSAEFKSVAADVAGYLDGLIEKAQSFLDSLNKANGTAPGSGQTKFNEYADEAAIAAKETLGAAQDVDQLTRVIENLQAKGGDLQIIAGLEEVRAKAQQAAQMIQQVNEAQSKVDFPGGVPTPQPRPAAADTPTGDGKIPNRKSGSDADPIKAATDALTKHTLATQADADAVGKGAAELAIFRAQAQEQAAVAKNGGKETADQAAQFKALEAAAGDAAQALAKAQVASTISRDKQTALFTPQDVAVVDRLKGLYGDDIPAAMKSTDSEAIKFQVKQ